MAPPVKLSKEDQAALDAANAPARKSALSDADQAALDAANAPVKKKGVSTLSPTAPAEGSALSSALSGATGASPSASTPATTIPLALTLQPKDLQIKSPATVKPGATATAPMTNQQGAAAITRNALQGFPVQLQDYNPLSSQGTIDPNAVDPTTGVSFGTEMSMMQGGGDTRDFQNTYSTALKTKDNQINSFNQSQVNDANTAALALKTPGTPEYNAANFKGVALPVQNTETALDQSRRYYRNYLEQYDPQKLAEHDATVAGQSQGLENTALLSKEKELAEQQGITDVSDVIKGQQAIAQKTKAGFDQEALMFSLQGADHNFETANQTLQNQYKPQLDIVNKIANWPKDANGNPVFNDAKEQQDYLSMVGEIQASPQFGQLFDQAAKYQSQLQQIGQAGRTYLLQYPEYMEQFNLTKEAERHGVEDLGVFRGDVLNPAIRTVASAAVSLSALPKEAQAIGADLTGTGTAGYDWTDRLYDAASYIYGTKAAQYFPMGGTLEYGVNPLTGQKEQIYKEGFLPSVVQSATQMGLIIASGNAMSALTAGTAEAATIGQVGAAAALSINQFYEAGKAAGMTDKEAMNYGLVSGIVSGLFMAVNPVGTTAAGSLENVATKSVGEYTNALVRGEGTTAARTAALKEIGKTIVGVNAVGVAQKLSEYATNYVANTVTGSNLATGQNIGQDMWDVVTMSTVMGGFFGALHHGGDILSPRAAGSQIFREALFAAASDPVRYKEALSTMKENGVATDDRVLALSGKIDRATAALASMPDGLTAEQKMNLLPDMIVKQQLKEQLKTTDEALKPVVEEKIAQVDEVIQSKVGIEGEIPKKTDELSDEELTQYDHLKYMVDEGFANDRETKQFEELSARMPKEEIVSPKEENKYPDPETLNVGDKVNTPKGAGEVDRIMPSGLRSVKMPDGSRIGYTPELWNKYGSPEKTDTSASETESVNTLSDALKKHDEEEGYTFSDMVNDVEGIAEETGNEYILSAVKKYREAQQEDTKLSGRGDKDEAETKFRKVIEDNITANAEADTTEATPKTQEDAVSQGIIEKSNLQEHQNGDESGQAESASDRNRNVESGQKQEEVTTSTEQEQPPAPVATSDTPEALKRIGDKLGVLEMKPEKGIAEAPLRTLFRRTIKEIDSAVKNGEITKETAQNLTDRAITARDKRINEPIEEATSRIIMALRKMKITSGGDEVKAGLDLESLIKMGAEVYKRAIAKGMDVQVAVDKAIESMKSNRLWKTFGGKDVEDRVRNEFATEMSAERKAQVAESPLMETEEGQKRMMAGARRFLESDRVTAEQKLALQEEGTHYFVTNIVDSSTAARDMIKFEDSQGRMDNLVDLLLDPKKYAQPSEGLLKGLKEKVNAIGEQGKGMDPLTRGILMAESFKYLNDKIADEKTSLADREKYSKQIMDLNREVGPLMTLSGKISSVVGNLYADALAGSEEGTISKVKADVEGMVDRMAKGKTKKAKDAAKQLNIEEEVSKPKKQVEPKKREKIEGEIKKLFEGFRSLPSEKPRVTKEAEVKPVSKERVKQTAEIMKKYMELGETKEAIRRFKKDYKEAMGEEAPKEMIQRALDEVDATGAKLRDVISQERKVNKVIGEKFGELSDKAKKKLVAEVTSQLDDTGRITGEQIKQKYAEVMKGEMLSDENIAQVKENWKVMQLATAKKKAVEDVYNEYKEKKDALKEGEQIPKEVQNDYLRRMRDANMEFVKAQEKAQEAVTKTARMFATSNFYTNYVEMMLNSMMSIASTSRNIVGNLTGLVVRLPIRGLAALTDVARVKGAKTFGIEADRVANLRAEMYGGLMSQKAGAYKSWRRFMMGSSKEHVTDFTANMNTVEAWKNILKGRKPGEKTSNLVERKIVEGMNATLGILPDLVKRLAALPDTYTRTMGEMGRAYELASLKTKEIDGMKVPLDDVELLHKTLFPDEADMKAIQEAGAKAAYMSKNTLGKIASIGDHELRMMMDEGGIIKHMAGVALVMKKTLFPFVTVPANIIGEAMMHTIPALGIASSIFYSARAKNAADSGNISLAADYTRKAQLSAAKAMFATAASTVITGLIRYGLITPMTSSNEKPGERAADFAYTRPGSFNYSAFMRKLASTVTGDENWMNIRPDDLWLQTRFLGTIGIQMNTWAELYRHDSQSETEDANPLGDAFGIGLMATAASSGLQQSYLRSEADFISFLTDPDKQGNKKWAANYLLGMMAPIRQGTITNMSRATDDYLRDTNGETVGDMIVNQMKNSYFMGDELPSKVNMWGDPIENAPKGTNRYYYFLMSPTQGTNVGGDVMAKTLFDFWRNIDDDDMRNEVWPKLPSQTLRINGQKVMLKPEEYREYQVLVGKERQQQTQAYVLYGDFADDDEATRIETLKSIYSSSRSDAEDVFIDQTPRLSEIYNQ